MDKKDSWCQHIKNSGEGCLYSLLLHHIIYELNTIAILQVSNISVHLNSGTKIWILSTAIIMK